ncbi:pantetheinase isoform X2 [Microcaecilia unicolor]|uniref:Pantetheinase-like isoform X2 n=1 Tax=Microcaecilia unicolor TaxID=1415580 RepID=A0A6P7XIZ1_9AMPH|nr:pantetheinase-like isoform X2 [Microcaecilia unicolor]
MVFIQLCVAFLFLVFPVCKSQASDKYIAAVYEHALVFPDVTEKPITPAEALRMMNINLDILEKAVKEAAKKGARIIVTPEDGLHGWHFNRETIVPYTEDVPDPQVNWIPCKYPQRFGPAPVQERLSCMAKDSTIYVVANIVDRKTCNSSDPLCPSDGRYYYNTNVVFDSEGKLVARYHKYNLFTGEEHLNPPKEPEQITFDTPFGKFGIFTCWDIMFYDPAVILVNTLKVDTILFPTAWFNFLPHLSAVKIQSAWAMGMGVNFLSSNIHNTSIGMTGSGIYAPDKPREYYYNMETDEGKLLVSELDVHPKPSALYSVVDWNLYANSIKNFSPATNVTRVVIYFDEYMFTELTEAEGNISICHGDLCCHLTYRMAEKRKDEVYALGIFNGLHVVEGQFYLQICTLVKCKTTNMTTCGRPVETSSTFFKEFSLSGTFGTNYVFPEVLFSGVQLAPETFKVLKDGRLISQSSVSSKPLLTATLYGRWYEKDSVKQFPTLSQYQN